jgi:hypothetical protein
MMPIQKICDTCELPFQAATEATSTCTSCLLRPSKIIFIKAPKSEKPILSDDKKGNILPGAKKPDKK